MCKASIMIEKKLIHDVKTCKEMYFKTKQGNMVDLLDNCAFTRLNPY